MSSNAFIGDRYSTNIQKLKKLALLANYLQSVIVINLTSLSTYSTKLSNFINSWKKIKLICVRFNNKPKILIIWAILLIKEIIIAY